MTLIESKDSQNPLTIFPSPMGGSIFSNGNFMYLWGAQLLTQIGVRLFDFVLAIQIFKATGSNAAVSYLILVYALPAIILSALAGVLVDGWNKKGTLIIINILRAILVVIFILLTKSFAVILLFAFLMSVVTQFFIPVEGSLIPAIVRKNHLLTANSIFTITLYAASILGYMCAGPLIKAFGDVGSYVFVSLMFFVAFFLVMLLPNIERTDLFSFLHKKRRRGFLIVYSELKEGLNVVKMSGKIQKSLIFMGVANIVVGMYMGLMPGLSVSILGLTAEDSSVFLVGPAAIGMVMGGIFVSKLGKKVGKGKMVNIGILGSSIAFMLISFMREIEREHLLQTFDITLPTNQAFLPIEIQKDIVLIGVILALAAGFLNSFIIIPSTTILQEETTSKNRGKIYGFLQTLITAGGAIPIVIAGVAADMFGIPAVFRVISILIFVLFILSIIFYGFNGESKNKRRFSWFS